MTFAGFSPQNHTNLTLADLANPMNAKYAAYNYLLSNQVLVGSSYWSFYGTNTFGITLVPMLIGIGILFFGGRSIIGWLLTGGGAGKAE